MNYINIDGKITTASGTGIPVDNGAFRYGYGLFETMLVHNGSIRLKQYHWDRLSAGMKQLFFDIPGMWTIDWLEKQVLQTVEKNNAGKLCRVRLQIFAAGGGIFSSAANRPGYIIECFPADQEILSINENGLVVGMATGLAKSTDTLSNLKSCNALIYAIAAKQAKENKWNDALICNTGSHVIESAIANIFWIKKGIVHTPPLSDGCVAGVMRRYIMEQIEVKEKSLSTDELMNVDEVFLTNAIKGIRWIGNFGAVRYKNVQTKSIYHSLAL